MRKPLLLLILLVPLPVLAGGVLPEQDEEPVVRELHVPFDSLNILLDGKPRQHVFLSRGEYERLLTEAKKSPQENIPVAAAILSADYDGQLEESRAVLTGRLVIDVLEDGLHAVPLDLAGVGIISADLDDAPAALGRDSAGKILLFAEGKRRHELRLSMTTPLQTTAAQQSLHLRLPTPAATRLRLSVPGNVDVKSGAAVVLRDVTPDGSRTDMELVPQRSDMSIVMSLNNRLLRRERVVVSQSVLLGEITAAYERLHATVSFRVLHGAVDQLRFAAPAGFEITSVDSPQLSEWDVDQSDPDQPILQVRLRESTTEPFTVNIAASRRREGPGPWTLPQLVPQDMASQVSIVGMLVEERLQAQQITESNLVPIPVADLTDNNLIPQSVFEAEPGAPRVRMVAAFYAPQPSFLLAADIVEPPSQLRVTTNLVLELDDNQQKVRGSFALTSEGDKLFAIDIMAPPGWLVTEASLGGHTNSPDTPLPLEHYDLGEEGSRVHVRLPRGFAAGELANVYFRAESTPDGWLGAWKKTGVEFPVFAVRGATSDRGAVAVAATDDFVVRPDELTALVPLDDREKSEYGLQGVRTNLVYRYDSQPYAIRFTVERKEPWITARTYSFFGIGADVLSAHYELVYNVENARADRFVFRLPAGTPKSLDIRGLRDVKLKEYHDEDENDDRVWTVHLSEPARGNVVLAVGFEQPLNVKPQDRPELPIVRADDVAYQSGVVAVEGDTELDVQVDTKARRVDVGELVDAEFEVGQAGHRLLGVYGFLLSSSDTEVADPPLFAVGVVRHDVKELPTTIVQSARLFTQISPAGRGPKMVQANALTGHSQTQADFELRTKALFLEVELPEKAELWSAVLDGKPCKPQVENDRLLLSLGAGPASLRNLQIVYAAPIEGMAFFGNVGVDAPRLAVRADADAEPQPVPVTHLTWNLRLPTGYHVTQTGGTVFTDELPEPASPLAKAAAAVYAMLGGVGEGPFAAVQSVRESARRAQSTSNLHSYGFSRGETTYEAPPEFGDEMTAPSVDLLEQLESRTDVEYPDVDMDAIADNGDGEEQTAAQPDPFAGPTTEDEPAEPRPPLKTAPPPPATPPTDAPPGLGTIHRPGATRTGEPAAVAGGDEMPSDVGGISGFESHGRLVITVDDSKSTSTRFDKLLGIASLKIELDQGGAAGQELAFESLGADPRLAVTVMNDQRMEMLAWAIALSLGLVGILLTGRRVRTKATYIVLVAVVAALLPEVTGRARELSAICDLAFFAALLLVPYYLLAGVVRSVFAGVARLTTRNASPAPAAAAVLVMILAATSARVSAAPPPPAKPTGESKYIVQVVEPSKPVSIPTDAIIIPYDPDKRAAADDTQPGDERVIVPYDKYVELWNRAYPDKKLEAAPPPAEYALAGAEYRGELSGEDFLALDGHIDIELFTDKPVAIPLPLSGGVLARAVIDGKPALLNAGEASPDPPAQGKANAARSDETKSLVLLHVQGKGRKRLELTIRLKLTPDGGSRKAGGFVPQAPATSLQLSIPRAQTEVRLGGVLDQADYETLADNEEIETALAAGQPLSILWQPKSGAGVVDRSVTVKSDAVLDVREDGLRLAWRLELSFPNDKRESFSIGVPPGPPGGYIIEKVVGDNVRGWERRDGEDGSQIEVTLLKAVENKEVITVQLSRQQQLLHDEPVALQVPMIDIPGAALHSGSLTVRRSPLLEVRVDQLAGLTRTDVDAETVARLTTDDGAQESPLGIRTYQAYHFNNVPFTLAATVAPVPSTRRAELRSKVIVADLETKFDTQITLRPEGAPVYRVEIVVPDNLSVDRVVAPGAFEWSVTEQDEDKVVGVYLSSGQAQPFRVSVFGSLAEDDQAQTLAIPQLKVLNVDDQEGDIVFLADPAFDVTAESLDGCQRALMVQIRDWIDPQSLSAARLALHYSSPDYSGTVRLVPREPQVRCVTVTNVNVGDERIEETILLEYTILEAGIKQVSFLMPARLGRARIAAPAVRQQTIVPVAPPAAADAPGDERDDDDPHIRVTLDLQEEMMGQFSVRVEYDRVAVGRRHSAPLPVVAGVENVQRFVTVQYSGFHDPIVAESPGIERLSRQQSQFRLLADMLGHDAVEGYSIAGNDTRTRFSYTTEIREVVATAGARIGIAETQLAVDAAGTFHARTVLKVHNTTEQHLEIRLPDGARLWTAEVAGRPVKPTDVPGGTNPQDARIPLRKTQKGDPNYDVTLTYGGSTTMPGTARSVRFPIVRVQNIDVERSLVRLYLPRDRKWFWFGGSMQLTEEGGYQADYQEYWGEEWDLGVQDLQSKNPYDQARAIGNLRKLKAEFESYAATNDEHSSNTKFQRNYVANAGKAEKLEELVQQTEVARDDSTIVDNRERLRERWRRQKASRARNVVQDRDVQAVITHEIEPPKPTEQRLNKKWLDFNQLENPNEAVAPDQAARLELGTRVSPVADLVLPAEPPSGTQAQPGSGQAQQGGGRSLPGNRPFQPLPPNAPDAPTQVYRGNAPAQPQAAGIQIDRNASDYTQPANGYAGEAQGEWEMDGDNRRGGVHGKVRRYQEKLEQKAKEELDQRQFAGAQFDVEANDRFAPAQSFSLDGRGLATADLDDNVTVWAVPAEENAEGEVASGRVSGRPAVDGPTRLPPGYASLTVDLVFDGKEYVFTSPRQGDITARNIRSASLTRLWHVGQLLIALAALLVLYRLVRYIGTDRLTGYSAATVLLVGGMVSICGGIFPIAGAAAILTAIILYVRRAARRRPRATASA